MAKVGKSLQMVNHNAPDSHTLTVIASSNDLLPAGPVVSDAGGSVTCLAPSNQARDGSFDHTLSGGHGRTVPLMACLGMLAGPVAQASSLSVRGLPARRIAATASGQPPTIDSPEVLCCF